MQVNLSAPPPPPADTAAPTVQVTSPVSGSRVSGLVSVKAAAQDNVGVAQLCIYVDDVLVATATGTSASYNWNTKKTTVGNHAITAKAWDASGNMAVSAAVTVTVTK